MDARIAGEDRPGAIAVVEVQVDDENRRREPSPAQIAQGDRHVVPQAEALAMVGEGVVEAAAQVDGDAAREREPGGEDGPAHHQALGLQDAVGQRVREVDPDDPEEGAGRQERVDVRLGVDLPELAIGGGLGGVQAALRGEAQIGQEGEDALAALRIHGPPGELDLVAPAVDQLDRHPPEAGEPPPGALAPRRGWGLRSAGHGVLGGRISGG